MQTHLAPQYRGTPEGQEAEAILRKCVHCGFCTATCPTYQELGDELDGPRGRIYLIKQVLEGQAPTRATQQHLEILSEIAELLSDSGLRESLKSANDALVLHELIATWQSAAAN